MEKTSVEARVSPNCTTIGFETELIGSNAQRRLNIAYTERALLKLRGCAMSETKVPIEALDFKADSYSPDGKTISFTSDRTGVNQIFVMEYRPPACPDIK